MEIILVIKKGIRQIVLKCENELEENFIKDFKNCEVILEEHPTTIMDESFEKTLIIKTK